MAREQTITPDEAFRKLIEAGKITQQEAEAYKEKLLLSQGIPSSSRTKSISQGQKLFNFHVIKWTKARNVERLILQFDFESKTLCCIQHGTRTKKHSFNDITSFESEDGQRLIIHFESQAQYEVDADTLDEKNKMIRLLAEIQRKNQVSMTEMSDDLEEEQNIEEGQSLGEDRSVQGGQIIEERKRVKPLQEERNVTAPWRQQRQELNESEEWLLLGDGNETGHGRLDSPLVSTYRVIMEGYLEKKGHSTAFFMWPKRWVVVTEGEMAYYKPEDRENALNILPLTPNLTKVKKVGPTGFEVILQGHNKSYSFRVCGTCDGERDNWCDAIQRATGKSKRHRTRTMKDTKRSESGHRMSQIVRPIAKILPSSHTPSSPPASTTHVSASASTPSTNTNVSTRFRFPRAMTVSFNKPKDRGELEARRTSSPNRGRMSSIFYSENSKGVDITTPLVKDQEFAPLNMEEQNAAELVETMKGELNSLSNMILPISTGTAAINLTLSRLATLASAIEDRIKTGKVTSSPKKEESLHTVKVGSPASDSHLKVLQESPGHQKALRRRSQSLEFLSSTNFSETLAECTEEQAEDQQPSKPETEDQELAERGGDETSLPLDTLEKTVLEDAISSLPSPLLQADIAEAGLALPPLLPVDEEGLPLFVAQSEESKMFPPPTSPGVEGAPSSPPGGVEGTPSSPPGVGMEGVPSPPPLPGMDGVPTPPPPFPGMGGVPPPPPFPGMDGVPPPPPLPGEGAVPPPPPPLGGGFPMQSSVLPPRQQLKTPMQKMRPLHWAPLNMNTVASSGWMNFVQTDKTNCLDLQDLEGLFCQTGKGDGDKKPQSAQVEAPSTLLDLSRARNIGIFLAGFHIPLDSIDNLLNKAEDASGGLDLEHIVALKRFQPSVEDKEMYKRYTKDKSNLQSTDQFLIKLCEIPLLDLRLDLLFTIREFPADFDSFQPTLILAWEACNQLLTCTQFMDVLQYVLAIGNFINSGSRKGGAYGFKISSLSKIMDFRGQDKKTTLTHYLISQLHANEPELLKFPQLMEAVVKAGDAEISTKSIVAELEVMERQLDRIERNLAKIGEYKDMNTGSLQNEVKEFVMQYRVQICNLDEKGKEMFEAYHSILEKFGEAPGTDSEELFHYVAVFIKYFQRVHKEMFPPPKPSTPQSKRLLSTSTNIQNGDSSRRSVNFVSSPSPPPGSDDTDGNSNRKSIVKGQGPQVILSSPKMSAPVAAPEIIREKANELEIFRKLESKPQRSMSRRVVPPPAKDGYLVKKARDRKIAGREWSKRYFQLEMGQLHYSEGKGAKNKIRDTIEVVGLEIALEEPQVLKINSKPALILKAESEQEASEWLAALVKHSQFLL